MFFLLKSAFWLSLVFYCMSWPAQEPPQALARQAAGELVARAQTAVVEKAAAGCSADPVACLALARGATAGRATPAHASPAPKPGQRAPGRE